MCVHRVQCAAGQKSPTKQPTPHSSLFLPPIARLIAQQEKVEFDQGRGGGGRPPPQLDRSDRLCVQWAKKRVLLVFSRRRFLSYIEFATRLASLCIIGIVTPLPPPVTTTTRRVGRGAVCPALIASRSLFLGWRGGRVGKNANMTHQPNQLPHDRPCRIL